MKDALDRDINVGDHVAVAFSYSHASVGHLRFGTVVDFRDYHQGYATHPEFLMRWDEGNGGKDAWVRWADKRFLVLDS